MTNKNKTAYTCNQEEMMKEEWVEEKIKEFEDRFKGNHSIDWLHPQVSDFIRTLLTQARTTERKRIADWAMENSCDEGYGEVVVLSDLYQQLK